MLEWRIEYTVSVNLYSRLYLQNYTDGNIGVMKRYNFPMKSSGKVMVNAFV